MRLHGVLMCMRGQHYVHAWAAQARRLWAEPRPRYKQGYRHGIRAASHCTHASADTQTGAMRAIGRLWVALVYPKCDAVIDVP